MFILVFQMGKPRSSLYQEDICTYSRVVRKDTELHLVQNLGFSHKMWEKSKTGFVLQNTGLWGTNFYLKVYRNIGFQYQMNRRTMTLGTLS